MMSIGGVMVADEPGDTQTPVGATVESGTTGPMSTETTGEQPFPEDNELELTEKILLGAEALAMVYLIVADPNRFIGWLEAYKREVRRSIGRVINSGVPATETTREGRQGSDVGDAHDGSQG